MARDLRDETPDAPALSPLARAQVASLDAVHDELVAEANPSTTRPPGWPG